MPGDNLLEMPIDPYTDEGEFEFFQKFTSKNEIMVGSGMQVAYTGHVCSGAKYLGGNGVFIMDMAFFINVKT